MNILIWCAWALLSIWLLWAFYVFCMAILRAHQEGRMTTLLWALSAPSVALALAFDVLMNYTLLAALTLDFPKRGEWTFSKRLERLVRGDGWRARIASGIARILDPFDPSGKHIK